MPRPKKQTNSIKLLNKLKPTNPAKGAFLFVLIFGLIAGGYYLYSSYASPTDGLKILAERQNTGEKPFDGDRLVEPETTSFRLYENGLVVCGNYTDATHPERYYTTVLTQQQITDFQSSVAQTGFFSLEKRIGNDGNVTSDNYQKLSFMNNDQGYVVIADPNYQKPAAYDATNALIDAQCASLTTPYQPEEVEVTTKVISNAVATEGTLTSETEVKASTQPSDQKVSGKKAKALNKSLGKKGQKVYKKGTQTVEVRADEVLPEGQSIVDGKTSENAVSAGLRGLLSSAKASAVDVPEAYTFCATDVACTDRDPERHLSATNVFFGRTISQNFGFYTGDKQGFYYGKHTLGYYKKCNPQVAQYYGCSQLVLGNVLNNIRYEISVENGWKLNRPRIFILGHNVVDPKACGIADLGPGRLQTGVTTYAAAPGYLCSGWGIAHATTAHELGHTFGLDHVDKPQDLMSASCNNLPDCNLNDLQGAWLVYNSKWLSPIPRK